MSDYDRYRGEEDARSYWLPDTLGNEDYNAGYSAERAAQRRARERREEREYEEYLEEQDYLQRQAYNEAMREDYDRAMEKEATDAEEI